MRARAEKLQQLFDSKGVGSCSKSGEPPDVKVWAVTLRDGLLERIHHAPCRRAARS